jgi:Flp pilus assembly protein TadG
MTPAAALIGLRAQLRRFAGDRRGVSALEFALVLPLMLTLYIGGAEVGDGMAIQFKSTLSARTVADLSSQSTTIDTPTMSSILHAAATVVAPYSSAGMVVTVSEVSTNATGRATITWSCALNGTARTVGSTVTLPNNVNAANISLIWGEVTYPYTPQMGYVITGTINMYQNIFFYPRMSTSVTGPSSCPTS